MLKLIPGHSIETKCLSLHLGEVLTNVAIFTLCRWHFPLSWSAQLAALIAEYILMRVCIVTVLYCLSACARQQTPDAFKLPLLREALVVLQEATFGVVVLYSVLQPFASFFTQPFESIPPNKKSAVKYPVLFIHGYACNAGFWYPVLRYLASANVSHLYTISLKPLHLDIQTYAQQIAERVESILAQERSEKLILVGHSMGGLVARAYMKWHGGEKHVAKLITLQTPHKGTELVKTQLLHAFSDLSMMDMTPGDVSYSDTSPFVSSGVGSDFLAELDNESQEDDEQSVPITSIYSYHDTLISPQESPKLLTPNSRNIPFAGIGHMLMPFYRCMQQTILRELLDCT